VESATTITRGESVRGEVVLQRRHTVTGRVDELIINGAFAMDSADTVSERALGRLASGARRVLLGGLGLGYTAAEVLSHPIEQLDIVELEGCLVLWAQDGCTDVLHGVAADPRVRLYAGDILSVLRGASTSPGLEEPIGPWDAILLDVDNGPDFLIHSQNAPLYEPPLLTGAYEQLRPGGLLAIWCQGEAPLLESTLLELGRAVETHRIEVRRGERQLGYLIYTLRRATPGTSAP
jgi:spermidine synthase